MSVERVEVEDIAGGYLPEGQAAFERCCAAINAALPSETWVMQDECVRVELAEDNAIVGYWIFRLKTTFLGSVWLVVGGALPPTMILYERDDKPLDVVLAAMKNRQDFFADMFGAKWQADFERPFLWDLQWGMDSDDLMTVLG